MTEEIQQFRAHVQLQEWTPQPSPTEKEHNTHTPVFEVTAITAGEGNGWHFTRDALQASLSLWEGVEVFVDHQQHGHRSLRDLAGVAFAARFEEDSGGVVFGWPVRAEVCA